MKTLQACKDEVAKKHGYCYVDDRNWYRLIFSIPQTLLEKYTDEAAELYASEAIRVLPWIKATDRLPEHMVTQFIKIDGKPYVGYYDYSLKRFMCPNLGPSGLSIENIEWLDEENVKSFSEAIREKENPSENQSEYITQITPPEMYWKSAAKELQAQLAAKDKEIEQLRELIKEIDNSLYIGEDLEDKDVLAFYVGVVKSIKEDIADYLKPELSGKTEHFTGPVVGIEDETPFNNAR